MRKRIVQIMMLLLLGATVNVAIAWSGSLYTRERPLESVKTEPIWASKVPLQYNVRSDNIVRGESLGLTHYTRQNNLEVEDDVFPRVFLWDSQEVICAGFPFRSLWMQCVAPGMKINPVTPEYWLWSDSYVNGLALPPSVAAMFENEKWELGFRSRYLPVTPIWPGFAINTIFYAGVLWIVFAFPFVMRRRRRIKRGLCPACAYPVGTSPVCTECGKPVIKQKAETQKAGIA